MERDDAWTSVRDRLVADLAALDDGSSLVVGEPHPPPGQAPPRRWFHLSTPSPEQRAGRYVQVHRYGDELLCEVSSAAYAEVDEGRARELVDAGWSDPTSPAGAEVSPNHTWRGRADDPSGAAQRLVDALQVLGTGVPDPTWRWERLG